ncbi:MAG: hypothetical protein ACYCSR_05495 [Thiomonas sp.]
MAFILIFADVMIGIFRAHQRLSTLMPPEAMAAGDPGCLSAGASIPQACGAVLLGALGPGLAAGVRFAAGEALMDNVREWRQESSGTSPCVGPPFLDADAGHQNRALTDPNDWADGSCETVSDDSRSDR